MCTTLAVSYRDTEALYWELWHYLEIHYDLESVKVILVGEDEAHWVLRVVELTPSSVFLLYRFHAMKHIAAAVGSWSDLYAARWRALGEVEREGAQAVLKEALSRAGTEGKRKTIVDTRVYLMRQWDGIEAWSKYARLIVG
jgi:hypothetical protein